MPGEQHVEIDEREQPGRRGAGAGDVAPQPPPAAGPADAARARQAEGGRDHRDGDAMVTTAATSVPADHPGDAPPGGRGERGRRRSAGGARDDQQHARAGRTAPSPARPPGRRRCPPVGTQGGAEARPRPRGRRGAGSGRAAAPPPRRPGRRRRRRRARACRGGGPRGPAAAGGGPASSHQLHGQGGHQSDHREVQQRADGAVVRRWQQPTEREHEHVAEHVGRAAWRRRAPRRTAPARARHPAPLSRPVAPFPARPCTLPRPGSSGQLRAGPGPLRR